MPAPSVPDRIAALLDACSFEVSPQEANGGALHALFPPGTTIFINHPPSRTDADVIAASTRLSRAGFTAVPHVVARRLSSFSAADDLLRRLAQEAGVKRMLLLGGDTPRPDGPFHSALTLLATGLLERHGIEDVAFAGYPEGHPAIEARTLSAALDAKLALAVSRGLRAGVVTQFGFDAVPIRQWIAARRAEGMACPVRIGLAGPASVAALAKYAVRCGIGASLRALTHGHAAIARILTEAEPDALIEALVAGEDPAAPIDGLHIFCFGGARRAAAWRTRFHAVIARSVATKQPRS